MRIAVVGTSNSLRRDGYVPHLKNDKRVKLLENYSIGASTSLLSLTRTQSVDFSQFDYCIIDFSVNEEVILKNDGLNLDETYGIVSYLVAKCIDSGCLPVIAILPRLMDAHMSRMRAFYRKFAKDFGLPFVDGYDLIDRISASTDVTKFGMFLDKAHIRPWVSVIFGRRIVDALADLFANASPFVAQPISAPIYTAVDLSDLELSDERQSRVFRKSSKAAAEFIRFDGPSRLNISVSGQSIVGLYLNLTETNCYALIKSEEDQFVMDVRSKYYKSADHPFVVAALPLRNPVPIAGSTVDLRSMEASQANEEEITHLPGELGGPKTEATGHLEIAKVFVKEQGVFTSSRSSDPKNHVDIVAGLDPKVIELAAAVFRSFAPIENDHVFSKEFISKAAKKRERFKAAKQKAEP